MQVNLLLLPVLGCTTALDLSPRLEATINCGFKPQGHIGVLESHAPPGWEWQSADRLSQHQELMDVEGFDAWPHVQFKA